MTSIYKFFMLLSIIILAGFFIKATQQDQITITDSEEALQTDPNKNVGDNYEIRAIKMPDHLEFAGEKVPLYKQDIYERMDRELHVNTYWQSNTLLYAKRANKFFPVIERILAEKGIPDDFKYLALIESGLR